MPQCNKLNQNIFFSFNFGLKFSLDVLFTMHKVGNTVI